MILLDYLLTFNIGDQVAVTLGCKYCLPSLYQNCVHALMGLGNMQMKGFPLDETLMMTFIACVDCKPQHFMQHEKYECVVVKGMTLSNSCYTILFILLLKLADTWSIKH